jgi:hypothetical protein
MRGSRRGVDGDVVWSERVRLGVQIEEGKNHMRVCSRHGQEGEGVHVGIIITYHVNLSHHHMN